MTNPNAEQEFNDFTVLVLQEKDNLTAEPDVAGKVLGKLGGLLQAVEAPTDAFAIALPTMFNDVFNGFATIRDVSPALLSLSDQAAEKSGQPEAISATLLKFAHETYSEDSTQVSHLSVDYAKKALKLQKNNLSEDAIGYAAKLNESYPGDFGGGRLQNFNTKFLPTKKVKARVAQKMRDGADAKLQDKIGKNNMSCGAEEDFLKTYRYSLELSMVDKKAVAQTMFDQILKTEHADKISQYNQQFWTLEYLQKEKLLTEDNMLVGLKQKMSNLQKIDTAKMGFYDRKNVNGTIDATGIYIALKEPAYLIENKKTFVASASDIHREGYELHHAFDNAYLATPYTRWRPDTTPDIQKTFKENAASVLAEAAPLGNFPGYGLSIAANAIRLDPKNTEQVDAMLNFIGGHSGKQEEKAVKKVLQLMQENFVPAEKIYPILEAHKADPNAESALKKRDVAGSLKKFGL